MNRRKEMINDYKRRRASGAVYTVTNTLNGKYVIGYSANTGSIHNRFQFAVTTDMAFHPKMRDDWASAGAQAFRLEIRERLEQQPEQSEEAFLDDLKTLEQLWRANLDASLEY